MWEPTWDARALHDDTVAGNLFRRGTLFRTGNRYAGLRPACRATLSIRRIYLRQRVLLSLSLSAEVGFSLETLTRPPSTRLPSDTELCETRSILEKPGQSETRLT